MEQLVNFIIRPTRADYNPIDDLLDQDFMLKGQCFQRKDLEVTNSRGVVLQCSHYLPLVIPEGTALPCVIYCHGNSGCRTDASEAAIVLLPSYITVFTLDFSGSGLSGGEHVTLGWNEKDDLKAVVNYLRSDENVSCIGLWGRSMGAVASLMYGAEDPSIAGIVLDSPFSDLVALMNELVDAYKYPLPRFAVKFAIQYMRKVIQKKAKFDIMDLNTIKVAKSCFVPVLIGHAINDDFIQPHHSERIYDAYVGDKNIIKFEGDHNSPRPQCYFDTITIFFHNVLNPPKDVVEGNYFDTMHDCSGKGGWDTMNEVGNTNHSFMEASKGLVTRNTEDSTNELRPKRPMSRTEVPSDIPSKEMQSGNEEAHEHNPVSSSSGLTCFEFFNGHPFGQFVPTTIDDYQCVEYPLDTLSNSPCNMEGEERMFMEAVIESLKDLENRHPHEEEELLSNKGTNLPESSQMDDPASSNAENCGPSKMDGSSTSRTKNTHVLACELPSPDMSISFKGPTFGSTPPFMELGGNRTSTRSDGSICIMNLSNGDRLTQDADILDGTYATLTVQKNPTRHIMDGLMHRWGLNFLRKSTKMKKEM